MNHNSAFAHDGQRARRNPRLLLAEDNQSMRGFLCEVLHADYEVEAVSGGQEAWEAAQRELPDLILSDVLMPGLDGISLVRLLRGDARTAPIPIVLLTASDEKELLLRGLETGADDFLVKPFSPPELLARLRSHRKLIELRRDDDRQGNERFRLIVESARDYAIFTLDAQRRVTSWNSGAEVITGYSANDIIGQSGDLIFTPEDRERGAPVQETQQAQEIGHFYNERWHLRKDGSRYWGSGVVMPLRESGPEPGSLKIMRDLTAFHQSEQARLAAEDRFALVVQAIQDYAIYMLDAEGRVTTWNPGAERIKGYTPEEIIGQSFAICFPPDAIAAGKPQQELAIAAAESRFHEEGWRMRKGGELYWGDELIVSLRDPNGGLIGFAKLCRDLTERKHHEDERARLLAAEQAARHEAEAANRTKDHFLAVLSHELRTPLAPVQMALYVMEQEKRLPASVREGLEMIRRNVELEVRLIGDLLDVSRIVHGKLELNPEPLDLHACIHEALEVCQGDIDAKGLELTVALSARRHKVLGEASRLQQVFWNLFKNAAKFTPAGGKIAVKSSNDGESIAVEVADTGLGIEASVLSKIFDPFEQGDPDRARLYGGLGLGLAISHAIVAAHGGELTAESPGRDQGATFRVRFSTAGK